MEKLNELCMNCAKWHTKKCEEWKLYKTHPCDDDWCYGFKCKLVPANYEPGNPFKSDTR